MKKVWLYLLFLIPFFGFDTQQGGLTMWVISPGSSFKVDGSTNVNNFTCAISNHSKPDTIYINRNSNQPIFLTGLIKLDVQQFDCRNPVMTADLRKTLKTKQYPHLIVRFVSMNRYPDENSKLDHTKGIVLIELAGVTKKFEINYKVTPNGKNHFDLVGSQKIHFSDFKIEPPRKLGGMIKTNDELNVEFNLKMKVM